MGNSADNKESHPVTILQNPRDWVLIDSNSSQRRYRNQVTKQQIQEYIFCPNQKISQTQELQCYQYRRNAQNNVVNVALFQKEIRQSSNCKSTIYKVWVESIKQKLSQINTLTLEQALYIFVEAMKGFKEIKTYFGHFAITDKMIGINYQGQIKVWLSESFELNRRIKLNIDLDKNQQKNYEESNRKMISCLCEIVGSRFKTQKHSGFPTILRKKIQKIKSFDQGIQLIYTYSKDLKLTLPSKIIGNYYNKISLTRLQLKKNEATNGQNKQTNQNSQKIGCNKSIRKQSDSNLISEAQQLRRQQVYFPFERRRTINEMQTTIKFIHQNRRSFNSEQGTAYKQSVLDFIPQSASNRQRLESNQQNQFYLSNSKTKKNFNQKPREFNPFRKRNITMLYQEQIEGRAASKSFTQQITKLNDGEFKPFQNLKSFTGIQKQISIQNQDVRYIGQGVIGGSGIIQNIRSPKQEKLFVKTPKKDVYLYESQIMESNERADKNFNTKRYSYTECYNKELEIRLTQSHKKQQFEPNITFDGSVDFLFQEQKTTSKPKQSNTHS